MGIKQYVEIDFLPLDVENKQTSSGVLHAKGTAESKLLFQLLFLLFMHPHFSPLAFLPHIPITCVDILLVSYVTVILNCACYICHPFPNSFLFFFCLLVS